MYLLIALAVSAAALLAQEPVVVVGQGVRFRDYRPLAGFVPVAINDAGEMAGNHPGQGPVIVNADGSVTVIGGAGRATAMNNRRQVVIVREDGIWVYDADSRSMEQRVASNGPASASGINIHGQIAGGVDEAAMVWNPDGSSVRIPVPLSFLPNREQEPALAYGINDSGIVAGRYAVTGGVLGIFRGTLDGFVSSVDQVRVPNEAGISNRGDIYYSNLDIGGRTTLLVSDGGVYRYVGRTRIFSAISPDGTRLAGDGFVAEACPVELTARWVAQEDRLDVDARADEDCEWYRPGKVASGSEQFAVSTLVSPQANIPAAYLGVAGVPLGGLRNPPACETRLPGNAILLPAEGATRRMHIDTAENCSWAVTEIEGWATADPMRGTGPGELRLTVLRSSTTRVNAHFARIGTAVVRVVQRTQPCFYEVSAPARVGAGNGGGLLEVNTPDCPWSFTLDVPWIRLERQPWDTGTEYFQGLTGFTVDANLTGAERRATLTIAGRTVQITQEAAGARTPLLVEMSAASGPRASFRISYADGALTGVVNESTIEFGRECVVRFERGNGSFTAVRNTGCAVERATSELAGGLLTLTLEMSFSARGLLGIAVDGRMMQSFLAASQAPGPPVFSGPSRRPGDIYVPATLMAEPNSTMGQAGGLLRFAFPAVPESATLTFRAPGAECTVAFQREAATFALANADGGMGKTMKLGEPATAENDLCVVDAGRSAYAMRTGLLLASPSLPMPALDVYVRFRSAWRGVTLRIDGELQSPVVTGRGPVGTYTVAATVGTPNVFLAPGLLRVGLPSSVPIERARIQVGACGIQYVSGGPLTMGPNCTMAPPLVRSYGNDLVFLIATGAGLHGAVAAEQTPAGDIASGLMTVGVLP